MEPDKFEVLEWFDMDKLPTPMFAADPYYIEALRTGKVNFDCL